MKPYYADDLVTLYHGDCREGAGDVKASAVICDPPYGVTKNAWDRPIPWPEFWEVVQASEARAVALFAQGAFGARAILSAPSWMPYSYSFVWAKDRVTGFLNAAHMPLRDHEDIHVFRASGSVYNPQMWQGDALHGRGRPRSMRKNSGYGAMRDDDNDRTGMTEKFPRTVLHYAAPFPPRYPCEKPEALCAYLVATLTNPGEVILDPCAGSGTTLVAAKSLGRRAVGFEGTRKGCALAAERCSQEVLGIGGAA